MVPVNNSLLTGTLEYCVKFLAAMSSSRREDVTKCVCLCVHLESFFLVWSSQRIWSKMFWGSCKGVIGVSVWSFKGVWKFQGSFKGVSRKFKGCFKKISSVVQGSFNEISRVFQKSFNDNQVRLKGISNSFKGIQGYLKEVQQAF